LEERREKTEAAEFAAGRKENFKIREKEKSCRYQNWDEAIYFEAPE